MNTAKIGYISHGTLRNEDLIPCFMAELHRLDPVAADHVDTACVANGDYDHEEAIELCNELIDLLDERAPPWCYFGAHPGDGSAFGFWITDMENFDGMKVSDLSEVTEGYLGEVLLINDHGNMTLYKSVIKYEEVWTVV